MGHFFRSISCLNLNKTEWLAIGTDTENPESNNVSHGGEIYTS